MTGTSRDVVAGQTPMATPDAAADSRVPDVVLVGLLTLLTAAAAVFGVLFLPLYVGVVPLPLSAVAVAALVWVAVRACFGLTGSMLAAAAPAVAWLVVTVVLAFSRTLGYRLVLDDWRSVLLFGLGAAAASLALAGCWTTSLRN